MISRKAKILGALGLSASFAFVAMVGVQPAAVGKTPSPSSSAKPSQPAGPSFDNCDNLKGWYVNPDETTRRPIPTVTGLKFEGNDLVHHATSGKVDDLKPGTFVASPAPDQPSFFSVEVGEPGTYAGYATLRWNPSTSKWTMVVGGTQYENASPKLLVGMVTPAKSSNLLSFGVGYTNSPPGKVDTVVSSVTFAGKTWPLTCAPKPSASAKPSGSASSAPAVVPVGNEDDKNSLPVTGDKVTALLLIGGVVVFVGLGALWLSRRKRVRFSA